MGIIARRPWRTMRMQIRDPAVTPTTPRRTRPSVREATKGREWPASLLAAIVVSYEVNDAIIKNEGFTNGGEMEEEEMEGIPAASATPEKEAAKQQRAAKGSDCERQGGRYNNQKKRDWLTAGGKDDNEGMKRIVVTVATPVKGMW